MRAVSASRLISSLERFSVSYRSVSGLKQVGMKEIARKVAANMPPITPVPAEMRGRPLL